MDAQVFINLPVANVATARTFYSGLGFEVNEEFSNDDAVCLRVSPTIYVMALADPFFSGFLTDTQIANARSTTEVLNCLSLDSRQAVDDLIAKVGPAGGALRTEPDDRDGMYGASFVDPDGHVWELVSMPQ